MLEAKLNTNYLVNEPETPYFNVMHSGNLDQAPQCGPYDFVQIIQDDPDSLKINICKPLDDEFIANICRDFFNGEPTEDELQGCRVTFSGKEGLMSFDRSTPEQKEIVNRLAMSIAKTDTLNRIEKAAIDNSGLIITIIASSLAVLYIGHLIGNFIDSIKMESYSEGSGKKQNYSHDDNSAEVGDKKVLKPLKMKAKRKEKEPTGLGAIVSKVVETVRRNTGELRAGFTFMPELDGLTSASDSHLDPKAQADLNMAIEREKKKLNAIQEREEEYARNEKAQQDLLKKYKESEPEFPL